MYPLTQEPPTMAGWLGEVVSGWRTCPMTVPKESAAGLQSSWDSALNPEKSGWARRKPGNQPDANQAGSRSASPFSGCLGKTGSGVCTAVSDENRCSLDLNVGHGGRAGGREREGGAIASNVGYPRALFL
uniref:Uncharacterized protein n=1 Tax=Molossus molossus TaxID=27622 RepID=A0A7J8FYD9_MOLMO|nr:hypothetical protein HJG59_008160 [Molossus molossus]